MSKEKKYTWTTEHQKAFQEIKSEVEKITQNAHFDNRAETRVTCDAGREGLGAVLEQFLGGGWKPIAYASRFLNQCEQRYSTNELELLAVVRSIEHFRNYLYGRKFLVRTDHRAFLSALRDNRGNKTQYSRLTRWVDRMLPFTFKIEHIPGKEMRWADYLSWHPIGQAPQVSKYEEKFVIAVLKRIKREMGECKKPNKNAEKRTAANETRSDRTKERISHPTHKAKFTKAKQEHSVKTENRFSCLDLDNELKLEIDYNSVIIPISDTTKIKMLSEEEENSISVPQSTVDSFQTAIAGETKVQQTQTETSAGQGTIIPETQQTPKVKPQL